MTLALDITRRKDTQYENVLDSDKCYITGRFCCIVGHVGIRLSGDRRLLHCRLVQAGLFHMESTRNITRSVFHESA